MGISIFDVELEIVMCYPDQFARTITRPEGLEYMYDFLNRQSVFLADISDIIHT